MDTSNQVGPGWIALTPGCEERVLDLMYCYITAYHFTMTQFTPSSIASASQASSAQTNPNLTKTQSGTPRPRKCDKEVLWSVFTKCAASSPDLWCAAYSCTTYPKAPLSTGST
eukprot:1525464-Amphidinium_carterae.1